MAYQLKSFVDKEGEGDSNIYVGIDYLKIVAQQINYVREAERTALYQKEEQYLFSWLNEMKTFRDLIENKTGLNYSDKKIKVFEYQPNEGELIKTEIEIMEKDKYDYIFRELEKMIERNYLVQNVGATNPYMEMKHINIKKILEELGSCWRNLMVDANRKHLIMPEGMKNMKELAKQEWIDRDPSKVF